MGAPLTLAAYTIEGKSSKDCIKLKKMMMNDPALLSLYLSKLAEAIGTYACYQIEAGAQVRHEQMESIDCSLVGLGSRMKDLGACVDGTEGILPPGLVRCRFSEAYFFSVPAPRSPLFCMFLTPAPSLVLRGWLTPMAQVIQIFESWAHHLSPMQFEAFSKPYADRVTEIIKAKYPDVSRLMIAVLQR